LITVKFDDARFMKEMMNVIGYSEGFLDGIKQGEKEFLKGFGAQVLEVLKLYIDSNARINPQQLQHVYEWYQNGTPDGRLFDISYRVTGNGLSFGYTFSQSSTIQNGSNVPFYDKARIMEEGVSVTIKPRSVLVFDDNGEEVFTRKPVVVDHPGGIEAQDGFKKIFKEFFDNYFSQAFLVASGLVTYLENPIDFKINFRKAISGGRSEGIRVGIKWIAKAGTLGV